MKTIGSLFWDYIKQTQLYDEKDWLGRLKWTDEKLAQVLVRAKLIDLVEGPTGKVIGFIEKETLTPERVMKAVLEYRGDAKPEKAPHKTEK